MHSLVQCISHSYATTLVTHFDWITSLIYMASIDNFAMGRTRKRRQHI